ncbi:MAG: thiamine pyrophosphate-dependent enzyme, partial [Pseudomonadota bacterium]
DPWQLAKNFHTAPAMMGDPKTTLPEISQELRASMTETRSARAAERLATTRSALAAAHAELVAEARAAADRLPIDPLALMHAVGEVLPAEAIVIDETVSSGRGLRHFLKCDRADSYHGIRGGGIGWGIPGAVGVKLAHPDRPVVALVGDGSAMYTPQALWTAALCKTSIVFVILANRNYNILQQRLAAMQSFSVQANRFVGVELSPDIDHLGLGRSLGVEAHVAGTLPQFRDLLASGIRSQRPMLLEVEVARAAVG